MNNQELETRQGEFFQLPIDGLFKTFEAFLKAENNNRIFFSGRFGIGKSFFLKEFFKTMINSYDTYHLFPVNYQVYQNEDVFELVKFDILSELIQKNPDVFKENKLEDFVDLRNLLYIWGKDNYADIAKTLIEHIPRLGKPLKDVISLTQQFNDFTKEVKGGDKKIVENYIESVKMKSMDETDQISALIKQKVGIQKGEKKSVLILDDLDRVDPDHIFRLLNVFSAYFEKEHDNKFGFDHIILVGDDRNIQSIFHHKYGEGTDFKGYFDKFFSLYVYKFDNKEVLISNLESLLYKIKNTNQSFQPALDSSGYVRVFLIEILKRAIFVTENNKVNLRNLFKGIHYELPAIKTYGNDRRTISMNEGSALLDTAIKILLQSFGGNTTHLVQIISQCRDTVVEGLEFERGSFPNNVFSIAMMYKMYGRSWLESNINKNITYKKHNIQLTDPGDVHRPFKVGNEALLFYDLLINYVERELFNQPQVKF